MIAQGATLGLGFGHSWWHGRLARDWGLASCRPGVLTGRWGLAIPGGTGGSPVIDGPVKITGGTPVPQRLQMANPQTWGLAISGGTGGSPVPQRSGPLIPRILKGDFGIRTPEVSQHVAGG